MIDESSNRSVGNNLEINEPLTDASTMSQWRLIWLRFKRNRLAMAAVIVLSVMYIMVALAGFLAPNEYEIQNRDYIFGPPSTFSFSDSQGNFSLRPYLIVLTTELDQEKFEFVFKLNNDQKVPVKFFVKGDPYKLLGIFETEYHLFGVEEPYRIYLAGADTFGRDMFARTLVGGQISLTVGWVGVFFTIIFGTILGTASGYFGGLVDEIMQRSIEVIMSFPTIPLWAALAAVLPPISNSFTPVHRYFLITVILSLISWTGLARQLRAKVFSYRQSDFTQAALVSGASDIRIIFTHMIPNAASHIIVVAALAVPSMILGETALSFLGLGILPPMVSWGALLRDAQQVTVVVQHPWLMIPGLAVIITVLFFSFLGDGLRDAVDPYSI